MVRVTVWWEVRGRWSTLWLATAPVTADQAARRQLRRWNTQSGRKGKKIR